MMYRVHDDTSHQPNGPPIATMPTLDHRDLPGLFLSMVAFALAIVLFVCDPPPLAPQSLTIGAAELRSGERHRQDALEVEARARLGILEAAALASFRHGENDHANRPWPPFMAVTAGPRIGWVALHAGLHSYPWSVDRWTPLAGPRLDVPLGHRVSLHVSNLWRRDGLVGTRMGRWTPITRFRIDYALAGGR